MQTYLLNLNTRLFWELNKDKEAYPQACSLNQWA